MKTSLVAVNETMLLVAEDVRMALRAGRDHLGRTDRVLVAQDADRDADAPRPVAPHPVLHHPGDQVRVRHDHGRAVEGLDLGGADRDPLHDALLIADHHLVADPDRALPQEQQPGDPQAAQLRLSVNQDRNLHSSGSRPSFLP